MEGRLGDGPHGGPSRTRRRRRQDLPWESLNYARSNNASVTIVGDKVVASTSFGRVYVFTADGEALGNFLAWEPVDTGENVITTYVLGGKVTGSGDDNVVITPSKTVIQGAAASAVSPVEHPDANSVLVYNLQGGSGFGRSGAPS